MKCELQCVCVCLCVCVSVCICMPVHACLCYFVPFCFDIFLVNKNTDLHNKCTVEPMVFRSLFLGIQFLQ